MSKTVSHAVSTRDPYMYIIQKPPSIKRYGFRHVIFIIYQLCKIFLRIVLSILYVQKITCHKIYKTCDASDKYNYHSPNTTVLGHNTRSIWEKKTFYNPLVCISFNRFISYLHNITKNDNISNTKSKKAILILGCNHKLILIYNSFYNSDCGHWNWHTSYFITTMPVHQHVLLSWNMSKQP